MRKLVLVVFIVTVTCTQAEISSQGSAPPQQATDITKADIEAVLNHGGTRSTDRQIRVVDLGKYNLGVGILHRGATKPGAPVTGIAHTQVTEIYYVVSGGGTLITGGAITDPKPFPADSEVVTVLVGPSLSAPFQGGQRRRISAGDIVIIPPGVLHGWTDIDDHVTYLSLRPDTEDVLPAGYVHQALKR